MKKYIIKDLLDNHYLEDEHTWVEDITQAKLFNTEQEAEELVTNCNYLTILPIWVS